MLEELKIKTLPDQLELDVHIGCINVHLSPHLVYLLTEIASGLASPGW